MTTSTVGTLDEATAFVERPDISARSLLVTAWGDTITAVAESIWLSDLFALMAPFPYSERLLRTSLSRLQVDGWVSPERDGRRSRYELTPDAVTETQRAEPAIYGPRPQGWHGDWTLAFCDDATVLDDLRSRGFGVFRPGVAARPARPDEATAAADELRFALVANQAAGPIPIASARFLGDPLAPGEEFANQLEDIFELAPLAAAYEEFSERYGALSAEFLSGLSPSGAFAIRTMAVHEYRRIRLRDPLLPIELLAPGWSGDRAEAVIAGLYSELSDRCWEWAQATIETSHRTTTSATERFTRFTDAD